MVIVEKSFPRGGTAHSSLEKTENIVFGAVQTKKHSKEPKKKVAEEDEPEEYEEVEEQDKIQAISAELLNYQTIQDGMVIYGTVKSVDAVSVKVSLPGRMTGKVMASSISESYNKILKEFVQSSSELLENYKPLNALYEVGQSVYAKVMELKGNENGMIDINLSLKPSDVHSEMHHENVRIGMIFNGAVEEVQEHGYIIESGIRNLRCFLPLDKGQEGRSIGELVFMKIEKLTQNKAASTAICKEVQDKKRKIKDQIEPNLDYIMPSTVVNFQVKRVMKNGLQGTIMNGAFTAYVNEHQLNEPLAVPEDFALNSTVAAKVLYVMPLTKLVYLSLNFTATTETAFQRGDLVEKAVVHHIGTGGIVLALNDQFKGVLSFKTIKANYKGNFDQDEILNKYCKRSKHTVRILDYDQVDNLYVCTDDAQAVAEKYFTIADLTVGELVNGKVLEKDDRTGGFFVNIGKVRGLIDPLYLSSTLSNLQPGTPIRCRVLGINPTRKIAIVTNRAEFLSKTIKVLSDASKAKENRTYLGTIVKCAERFFIVKFFNDLKGILYKNSVAGIMQSQLSSFHEGQTMNFRVVSRNEDRIVLGLSDDSFKMGEIVPATITHILPTGLEIAIEQGDDVSAKGVIPIRLVSDYPDLVTLAMRTFNVGDAINACCIVKNIFSLREVPYFSQEATKTWKTVNVGDVLRGFIKNVDGEIVQILLPIQGYEKLVKVHLKMFLTAAVKNPNIVVTPDQVVYVKVLSKEWESKTLTVSAKLTDIWDGNLKSTGQVFEKFLDEMYNAQKVLAAQDDPLGKVKIGERIEAKLHSRNEETGDWFVELPNGVQGLLKKSFFKNDKSFKAGQTTECIALWVDYLNQVVYVSNKKTEFEKINADLNLPKNLVNKSGMNAKVLLKLDNVVVCSLKKGPNPIVFLPTRLHFNDFESTMASGIDEGEFVRLTFINDVYPIAVLEHTFKLWTGINRKRKLAELEEAPVVPSKKAKGPKVLLVFEDKKGRTANKRKNTKEADNGDSDDSDYHFKEAAPKPVKKAKSEEIVAAKPALPGASDFWSTDLSSLKAPAAADDSSDEEPEVQTAADAKKKKKQTAADRFRAAKDEEARLREIEEKYANPNVLPETADQFDRLVVSDPNSSKNWINYMVFHLQATEIDKARAVARKALKAISFREEQEIINIWVALLNLELRYGSKDSFKDILKEAISCNDPLKIYVRVFEILSDAKKTVELTEAINLATKKFKESVDVWRAAAEGYFVVGLEGKAKQLLSKALAVLPEREHINVTVLFANLNHKYGDSESAHALLEQIITSYPKRVDVWSQYIDMLIKDNQIDSARNTLERAVIQKIPLKKMKTLFKKFLDFEEKFGTEESVQTVKDMAAKFLEKEING